MPNTRRMATGNAIANSITATPRSSQRARVRRRLDRDMTEPLGGRSRRTASGEDTERGVSPPQNSDLVAAAEFAGDRFESVVDLATENANGDDDGRGDQRHEQAVLDAGRAALVACDLLRVDGAVR